MDVTARQNVAVLGATGSIGKATCEVLRHLGHPYRAFGLTAHRDLETLQQLATSLSPEEIVLSGGIPGSVDANLSPESTYSKRSTNKDTLLGSNKWRVREGTEALVELASSP
jgi:1-deoxy-D-xylulose 5-phosphate reductoisomerase